MTDDSELLRQYAQDRSEAAFSELVRRHIDFVYGVALRHARTTHRAEDATQAVFTDLARKAGSLSQRTELVGWLYTSARYAAYKIVRSEVRREKREQEADVIQEPAEPSSTNADWREIQPLLDDALNGLGEKDRSAVLLRCVKNLSFADVGAALQLSEEAARKRVDRALDRLRDRLTRHGVASTATALALALTEQGAIAAPASLAASVSTAAVAAGNATPFIGGLIQIMSTSKIIAATAVVAGALAITAAWHEPPAANRAAAALAEADLAYTQISPRLAQARQNDRAADQERANLVRALASLQAGPQGAGASEDGTASGRRGGTPAGAGTAAADSQANADKAAAIHREGTEYIRSGVRMDLLAFAKFMKLSPQQIDALADIEASSINVVVNGVSVPGNPPDKAQDLRAEVVSLLGLADARRLGAEGRAMPYQKMTAELAGNLTTDEPLDAPAATQLTAILAKNQVDISPDAWTSALSSAANVLSPSQLAAHKTYASSKTGVGDYSGGGSPR